MSKTVPYRLLMPLLLLFLFCSVSSGAETPPPFTLKDCLRIALESNPAGRSAAAGVQAARDAVGIARAPYYPEVGLQAGYRRFQTHIFFPTWVPIPPGVGSVVGPTDDWLGGLRARYTLYDFGERDAQVQIARAGQGLAEEESARIRQDILLAVYSGFFGLTSALEARSVAEQNLERTRDHLRLTRERKEAGAVPKADVLRAQVEVSNAELALVRAENLIRLARGNLNGALGRPAETAVEVAADYRPFTGPEGIDLDKSFRQAEEARPEIRAARKRIEASRVKIQRAQSAYGPRLKAEGGYGWRDSDFLPQDQDWQIGVSIEWPLFTGFARQYQVAQSRAELSKEEADAQRLGLAVRQEVWNAFSRIQEAYRSWQTTEVLVADALESRRLTRERYEAGAGTVTDLLDAQTALARAQANRVEAAWDYQLAQANFKRATGRLGVDAD